MTLQQEDQLSLSSLLTSAIFLNVTLQTYPVSRSHWNDEKTKVTCIFIGRQRSDKFTQVKVGPQRHGYGTVCVPSRYGRKLRR